VNTKELLAKEIIPITVKPGAPKTEILGIRNGTLHIVLHAPPVEGKANEELLKFLKKQTGKQYKLIAGATTRKKLVRLV
jgi:uncharacterized protein